MLRVNLFDREFIHTEQLLGYITCSDRLRPEKIVWVNGLMEFDGITVFTERYIDDPIVEQVKSKVKVLWLLEPPVIHPYGYQRILQIEDKFDYVLTYNTELLARGPKYLKYIVGQSRVPKSVIYSKKNIVSMIASNKQQSVGHRFRHEIANKLADKHKIHMWGSGYKPFDEKVFPLGEYFFSISVMNCKMDNFFTEVLVDNFMLETIPIFWGCPNIGEYFNMDGIITFDTIEELDELIPTLNQNLWWSKLDAIDENKELAKKYVSTDDIIADVLNTIQL